MVNEFEKPLGQKPEKLLEPDLKGSGGGKWLGLAGLITGLAAIGLVGWQMLSPPAPVVTPEAVVAQNDPTKSGELNANEQDNGEQDDRSILDDKNEQDSANEGVGDGEGLTELEPNGSISIPTRDRQK